MDTKHSAASVFVISWNIIMTLRHYAAMQTRLPMFVGLLFAYFFVAHVDAAHAQVGSFAKQNQQTALSGGDGPAFDQIEAEVRDLALDSKTLVVWIVDRAANVLISQTSQRISRMLNSPGNNAGSENLSAALVAFGKEIEILTPEPLTDGAQLIKQLAELRGGKGDADGKRAYAAVARAAETFAPYRQKGYVVVFVLLANDAVPDEDAFQAALKLLKPARIPLYSFGPPLPFYARGWKTELGKPLTAAWGVEHLSLATPAKVDDANYVDSGYGNFGLERICRATEGGKFFHARARGSAAGWETGAKGEIKAELLRAYAPDYVSAAEYQRRNDENKARAVLLETGQSIVDAEFEPPVLIFLAGSADNQANFVASLSLAQQKAAVPEAKIEKVYNLLQAGESDRAKLKNKRWEASYDLAMGRVHAALARTKGYNKMLAQLKSGKTFANPASIRWELVPAENFSGDSQLNTLAKKSSEYLKRVVTEHRGTPWAHIAEKELGSPCGWEWMERQ